MEELLESASIGHYEAADSDDSGDGSEATIDTIAKVLVMCYVSLKKSSSTRFTSHASRT